MFGQTGSGKTHTMSAIEELAARDLFEVASANEDHHPPRLAVEFIEIRGNHCFDLLATAPKDRLVELIAQALNVAKILLRTQKSVSKKGQTSTLRSTPSRNASVTLRRARPCRHMHIAHRP